MDGVRLSIKRELEHLKTRRKGKQEKVENAKLHRNELVTYPSLRCPPLQALHLKQPSSLPRALWAQPDALCKTVLNGQMFSISIPGAILPTNE